MRFGRHACWIPFLAVAVVRCAGNSTDGGALDASPPDASAGNDGASADLGSSDLASRDGAAADLGPSDGSSSDAAVDAGTTFTISGTVSFDWVAAVADPIHGARLDYANPSVRPARRVVVQALQSGIEVTSTLSDDRGHFALEIPSGRMVSLRARAEMRATGNRPDGIPPDACSFAGWDVRAVDNTRGKAQYVLDGASRYVRAAHDVVLHAGLVHQTRYTVRSAPPFALLDIALRQIELVCRAGAPAIQFPQLFLDWSPNNSPIAGDPLLGEVGSTHHALEQGVENVYVLGQEDVDTDEYDGHVVGHELGHYLESAFYRSDARGGDHQPGDLLEPSSAFSEGLGNAVAAMIFDDPIYVDTSSTGQLGGFSFDVSVAPVGNDRGNYSETSVQYLLWSLYQNRDPLAHHGSFDRIHQVLFDLFSETPALTDAQSFAAFYNETYGGAAEGLADLWSRDLDTPYDSLCAGACSGSGDPADVFDLDNDLGQHYAATRRYPGGSAGSLWPAEFWQLYRPLAVGTSTPSAHDQTRFGGYRDPLNKLGSVRAYRALGLPAGSYTAALTMAPAGCAPAVLDLSVRDYVHLIERSATGGCPEVSFNTADGLAYLLVARGSDAEQASWNTVLTRQKPRRPAVARRKDPVQYGRLARDGAGHPIVILEASP